MLTDYPNYIGFDVNSKSIQSCKKLFSNHPNVAFHSNSGSMHVNADLVLSLDISYHRVDDDIHHNYMWIWFESSMRWVVEYSSNTMENSENQSLHVIHKKFKGWLDSDQPIYQLWKYFLNVYSKTIYGEKGSFVDFYIYEKGD